VLGEPYIFRNQSVLNVVVLIAGQHKGGDVVWAARIVPVPSVSIPYQVAQVLNYVPRVIDEKLFGLLR
jgi:hypothetical protein